MNIVPKTVETKMSRAVARLRRRLSFFLIVPHQPRSTLFPYTTLFRSRGLYMMGRLADDVELRVNPAGHGVTARIRARLKRSEEHTSELQSQFHLVCRLLLEKKNVLYYEWKKKNLKPLLSGFWQMS